MRMFLKKISFSEVLVKTALKTEQELNTNKLFIKKCMLQDLPVCLFLFTNISIFCHL